MTQDPQTLRIYAEQAEEYARLTDAPAPGRLLSAFIADVPAGGRVLDLGCGPGVDAGHMAAVGLNVDAFDATPKMVALASQKAGVNAYQIDFEDFAAMGTRDRYDGIWANFSLLHAPRDRMPAYIKCCHRALRTGGRFHIALKTGTGTERDSIGRLYTFYTVPDLRDIVAKAGFAITDQSEGRDIGLSGDLSDWVLLAATA